MNTEAPREILVENMLDAVRNLLNALYEEKVVTVQRVIDDLDNFSFGVTTRCGVYSQTLAIKIGNTYIIYNYWLGLQLNLYMKTIKNLGTEKHRPYLERAATFNEMGELSHGSDV